MAAARSGEKMGRPPSADPGGCPEGPGSHEAPRREGRKTNMLTPRNHLIGLTAALIVVALAGAAPAASAEGRRTIGDGGGGEKNPRVLPPGSSSFGKSYGEWSAQWWQWAFSFR